MGWVVWGLKGRGTAFFFTAAMLGMIICFGGGARLAGHLISQPAGASG